MVMSVFYPIVWYFHQPQSIFPSFPKLGVITNRNHFSHPSKSLVLSPTAIKSPSVQRLGVITNRNQSYHTSNRLVLSPTELIIAQTLFACGLSALLFFAFTAKGFVSLHPLLLHAGLCPFLPPKLGVITNRNHFSFLSQRLVLSPTALITSQTLFISNFFFPVLNKNQRSIDDYFLFNNSFFCFQ